MSGDPRVTPSTVKSYSPLAGCETPQSVFARFADARAVGAVLRDQLSAWFASDEILAGCTLAYRRFKTPLKATTSRKSSLLVCYELDVVNSRTSDRRSLFLYAQAYL